MTAAVVDVVSAAAVVDVTPEVALVDDEDVAALVDDDDEDVVVFAAVSLSPRFPGCAMASTTPTTKRRAAAAPRIANRRFRGDSPHLIWSG